MTRRRLAALAVLAILAVTGCSTGHDSHRDDRARVTTAITAFGHALAAAGEVGTVGAVRMTSCGTHSAAVQWSAAIKQGAFNTPQRRQYEIERNVLSAALAPLRLDSVRMLDTGSDYEPVYLFGTSDRKTQLIVTVPRGQYVRVDGFSAC